MFYQPASLGEALRLKSELGESARFIAGGTDLVVAHAKGRVSLDTLIDISCLDELRYLYEDGQQILIGAMATHAMAQQAGVAGLAEAARTVGGPQIRNRGTIGGQLGTASPAGDVSVALLALDAEVELLSVRGSRLVPLREFFVHVGKTCLLPDELIASVRFAPTDRSAFYKIGRRNAVAISLVMGAVAFGSDGHPRIALGCVAPTPLRLTRTEAFLAAEGVTPATIAEARRMACEEVAPITDHRASADYRRDVSGVITARLLDQLTTGGTHAYAS